MTSNAIAKPDMSALTRESGGFAMLAVDQREAMRAMFTEHQDTPASDEQIAEFKVRATTILSPHASGVLVDKQFAWDRIVTEGAVSPNCGLIAAADRFIPSATELVSAVEIDPTVDPQKVKKQGAIAQKLLVVWRPDTPSGPRIDMVTRFVRQCQTAGLISIVEPVSRARSDGGASDWDEGVLAAARELGSLGADLYKAEVPLHAQGSDSKIRRRCARLTETISSPWVVLSSGVPAQEFPRAVELACREGASGFLAGRAVWRSVIGATDVDSALREHGVAQLQRLSHVVDTFLQH